MRRNGRFNLALGAALLARPVDDHDVQLVANLAGRILEAMRPPFTLIELDTVGTIPET